MTNPTQTKNNPDLQQKYGKNFKPLSKRQISKLNRQRNEDSDLEYEDTKSIGISSDYSTYLTNSTQITGDSIDSNHEFDLYKPDGSLVYIKQKYKMYLDWLNENKKNTKSKRGQKQLSWYTYEKHFHKNEYLKYLKNYSDEENEKKSDKKFSSSSKRQVRAVSTISLNLPNESSIFLSSASENGTAPNTERKESKAKEVKFESLNNLTSSSFSNSSISSSNSSNNLKSILKMSQNKTQYDNPYLKNRLSAKSQNRASTSSSDFKLPPILVHCSEDFYAVLHELEKEKFV
ncbi:unnamed protein product [Brachionus calyciflorus]|uniref:Uncharacterized protein n=1 Tax=Brachionus calyciflorus TaxID=104777 RepID=A0A813NMB3_9BILA|nr:unnamed protein product [Brachionus calyciflorus]